MTPTREQVIEWAKQSGFGVRVLNSIDGDEALTECCGMRVTDELERLAALAYSAGRLKGLEEAKEVCYGERVADTGEESDSSYNAAIDHCAAAIDQLKEQK
jgi:hypothetical protein